MQCFLFLKDVVDSFCADAADSFCADAAEVGDLVCAGWYLFLFFLVDDPCTPCGKIQLVINFYIKVIINEHTY